MLFHRYSFFGVFTAGCLVLTGSLGAEELGGEPYEPFGFDLTTGWFQAPHHSHLSPLGTPLIHSFRLEPAFTHRDLFIDYGYHTGPEGYENEIELELEWAITRRFGMIFEVPYIFESPDGGPDVDGFGDFAFSPRLLLVETERFLMSFGVEAEAPTGDAGRGLGDDEWKIAPNFATWYDLGNWWTLNTQIGWERTLESDSSEMFVRASLIKTLRSGGHGHDDHDDDGDQGHGNDHLEPGNLSLLFEVDGMVGLTEEEDGVVTAEGIVGLYYGLGEDLDVRFGYAFPLSEPREIDSGVSIGLVKHF